MNSELISFVISNTSLLLALSIIYAVAPSRAIKYNGIKSIIVGLVIGLVGIGVMVNPYELAPGIIINVRSILISITALMTGIVPTVIASIITIVFRIVQGGDGALAGVSVIVLSAIIGTIWRYFRMQKIRMMNRRWHRLVELYVFGLITNAGVLVCMTLLPAHLIISIVKTIAFPVMGIYPVGTVILGMLLLRQIDQYNISLQLKESEERFRVTLLSVGDAVITTDQYGNITLINEIAEDITGWDKDKVIGKPINSVFNIVNEYSRTKVENPVEKVLETGRIIGLANHTVLIREDGTERPIADSAAPIKDDNGNIVGVVLVIRDVTEERKKQQEINYLGFHDGLTGIYNRRFFDEEIKRLDVERNLPLSIIIGDVNGLKLTNDAFGHAVGDQLLKEMAKEIKNACREDDIVARWGGDEFIILLPSTDEKAAKNISSRIKENCSRVKMAQVNFSISLGYETKKYKYENIMDVVKSAEDYMYKVKSTESSSMRGDTISTILYTLHEKSQREQLHSNRVSQICNDIGLAMNLSDREVNELKLVGLMHDIGKIAISDRVLNKKGKLTAEEWAEMKKHPEIGYRILSASNEMAYIAEYVLNHHERLDGSGYPNGIIKDKIPVQSRILAIADSYDAMTSERPYKDVMTKDDAVQELLDNAGTLFDTQIVEVFIKKVLRKY